MTNDAQTRASELAGGASTADPKGSTPLSRPTTDKQRPRMGAVRRDVARKPHAARTSSAHRVRPQNKRPLGKNILAQRRRRIIPQATRYRMRNSQRPDRTQDRELNGGEEPPPTDGATALATGQHCQKAEAKKRTRDAYGVLTKESLPKR